MDFIADLNKRVKTFGSRSEEKPNVVLVPQEIDKRINVWITGNDKGFGTIAACFGPLDSRNYVGPFRWSHPIEKTRVGLAAMIRAVSIVLQSKILEKKTSIVIHVRSKYLYSAINEWFKVLWTHAYPKDRNRDMYKIFIKQVQGSDLKMMCVLESRDCGKIIIALANHCREFIIGRGDGRILQKSNLGACSKTKKDKLIFWKAIFIFSFICTLSRHIINVYHFAMFPMLNL